MDTKQYSELRQRAQGDCDMACRVWDENLAAFWVDAPRVAPPPTAVRVVATSRESEAGNG